MPSKSTMPVRLLKALKEDYSRIGSPVAAGDDTWLVFGRNKKAELVTLYVYPELQVDDETLLFKVAEMKPTGKYLSISKEGKRI